MASNGSANHLVTSLELLEAIYGAPVGPAVVKELDHVSAHYRAFIEATAFGTRMIVDAHASNGVPVTELVVCGGLVKDSLIMQIYADVTRLPLSIIDSEQGPALGSAIHAAVAAGAYPDVPTAAKSMSSSSAAKATVAGRT